MVAGDSADVWARPREFRRDRRVGTPPDAFSATGQDWGLPGLRLGRHARTPTFAWLEARAARAGALYDLFRVDHVIGLFRTWTRPLGSARTPAHRRCPTRSRGILTRRRARPDRAGQRPCWGSSSATARSSPRIWASCPRSCPRRSRAWHSGLPRPALGKGRPRDASGIRPATRSLSVATTGTHDVEPIAVWYDALAAEEKRALLAMPGLRGLAADGPFDHSDPGRLLHVCRPRRFGDGHTVRFRIFSDPAIESTCPGTVAPTNWTTRMPVDLDALENDRETRATPAPTGVRV